jgi:DNA-binding beta-propeller fold protein YncE
MISKMFTALAALLLVSSGCGGGASPLERGLRADAGSDQTVSVGQEVILDGRSSQPRGGIVAFLWVQTDGTPVELSEPDAGRAVFAAPDEPGILSFSLVITDANGNTDVDEVTVRVRGPAPPRADAGADLSVLMSTEAQLDGTNSTDPDDDIESYRWAQLEGTPVSLDDASAVDPTFVAPTVLGRLVFELTVADATGRSDTDEVQVYVTANVPPSAVAGDDQRAEAGQTVEVDGRGSFDPDGVIRGYQWRVTSGPSVALEASNSPVTRFEMPRGDGPIELELRVIDDAGAEGTDRVRVLPVGAPPQLRVTFPTEGGDFEARASDTVVRGTAMDPDQAGRVDVSVNGVEAVYEDEDSDWWSVVVPVPNGRSTLEVLATDPGGERARVDRTIYSRPPLHHPAALAASPDGSKLIVLDEQTGLVEVDRDTGVRRIVNATASAPFVQPTSVAYADDPGLVYVTDSGADAVIEVELSGGRATILSSASGPGAGPNLDEAFAVAFDEARDRLLVYARQSRMLVGVDVVTGDRTEIVGGSLPYPSSPFAIDASHDRVFVGGGNRLAIVDLRTSEVRTLSTARSFTGFLWDGDQDRLVVSGNRLWTVDLETGALSSLSDTVARLPVGLVADPASSRLALSAVADTVETVNLDSGLRAIEVPRNRVGAGAEPETIRTLIHDPKEGRIFTLESDVHLAEFIRSIDPETGDRQVVAGPFQYGARGPRTMTWDPVGDRFLLGGSLDCELFFIARETGDRTDVTNDGCALAIAMEPGASTAYFSDRGDEHRISAIDLTTGEVWEHSGANRGGGLALSDPAPRSLLVDPAGDGLLALDAEGAWSIDLLSGDRQRIMRLDAMIGVVDPRLERGLLTLVPETELIAVDLNRRQRTASIPAPGEGEAFAVDADSRRIYFGRGSLFGPSALVTIDMPSGRSVVTAH